MLTRRRVLLAGSWLAAGARAGAVLAGAPAGEALVALPGKRPLIQRSFRPPNFETPLAQLAAPFTPNDAFFVRYHLAIIPQVDAQQWRLNIGGPSAQRP